MAIVFVRQSVSTVVDGRPVRLSKDQAWDSDDPVVAARPELFNDAPEIVHTSVPRSTVTNAAEQATAAPGETRKTRRRS